MDWLKVVLENLLPVAVTIAVPILLLLGKWFVRYLEKKLDFDISAQTEQRIQELIENGVYFAEEKARAALKVNNPTTGQEKLDMALKYVNEEVKRLGLDKLAAEKLTALLEAALFKARAKGALGK